MNILYILPVPKFFSQYNNVGGHIAHVYGIINEFTKQGHKLDIIAEETNAIFVNNYKSLTILPLGSQSIIKRQYWALKIINSAKKLNSASNPRFCYIRYSSGFSLWLRPLKKALKDTPLIIEVNSFAAQRIRLFRLIEKRALNNVDLITVVSEKAKKDLLNILSTNFKDKIVVIPNGVDVNRFQLEDLKKNTDPNTNLAYIGLLKFNYGLDVLLNAFNKVLSIKKNVCLHIVGDGPFLSKMKEKAKGNPNIVFHGSKSFFEIPKLIQNFDILINTSSHHRTFQSPTKIFEYMASGKPIISAENPQVKNLLGNEEQGLLYPLGDINALAKKIIQLIDDPNLANRLSGNALKLVTTEHSWKARVEKLFIELKQRNILND